MFLGRLRIATISFQLFSHAFDDVGEVTRVVCNLFNVEDNYRPGCVVNKIYDVIQCRRHHVDVFPVEGRDERLVEASRNVVSQLIAGVFQALYS
jgi:hypothetical protein